MYLVFDNIEDFNIWHDKVNKHLGYPNEETKTERYTDPITNEKNDQVVCRVDKDLPAELLENQTQITKAETIEQGFLVGEDI